VTSFYDLLGVAVDADFEQVRRAYHRQAQLLHPDRHPEATETERREAEAAMKELNEAWHTLRNADTRRRYDIELDLLAPDAPADVDVWDGQWPDDGWPDEDELERPSPVRLRKLWLAAAVVLVIAMLASAVAWFADPDAPSTDWSGGAVADLRLKALNAGMSAPQANCFVEAVTSRFGPSEEIPGEAVQYLADACR
jgi:curved DNA-binding protein CbpA